MNLDEDNFFVGCMSLIKSKMSNKLSFEPLLEHSFEKTFTYGTTF